MSANAFNVVCQDQLRDTMFLVSDAFIDATASNPFHRAGVPNDELRQLGSIRRRQRKKHFQMAVHPHLSSGLTAGDAAQPSRASSDTPEATSFPMDVEESRKLAAAQVECQTDRNVAVAVFFLTDLQLYR
jgi:hypothetical protein